MIPSWAGRFLVCTKDEGYVAVWGAFHQSTDWLLLTHAVFVRLTVKRPVWIEEVGKPAAMPDLPRAFNSHR